MLLECLICGGISRSVGQSTNVNIAFYDLTLAGIFVGFEQTQISIIVFFLRTIRYSPDLEGERIRQILQAHSIVEPLK